METINETNEVLPNFNHAEIAITQPLTGRVDNYTIMYGDHLRVWFEDGALHVEHISGGTP